MCVTIGLTRLSSDLCKSYCGYNMENKTLALNYYANINDSPVSDLLRQDGIKTDNQLRNFSGFSWQDCPDTRKSKGAYIIFYQGGPIDHGTHVPGPVDQSSAESDYNAEYTSGIALAHLRMLIHELLNKDTYIVPEEGPLILLDIKSAVCINNNNGKDTERTSPISRIMHLVRNGEKFNMHKIDWFEGGLNLSDIDTNNGGELDLTPWMKYILVRLDNWEKHLYMKGDIIQDSLWNYSTVWLDYI